MRGSCGHEQVEVGARVLAEPEHAVDELAGTFGQEFK
jgi:hypothetical protein